MFIETIDENIIIKIGRNQDENDKLLKEYLQNENVIWFHLHSFPSPHGFLVGSTEIENIQRTASLVKQFSKYKNLKNIKVEYLPIKYVKFTEKKGEVILKKKPMLIAS